jgi:anion-transporting  ArsA/GET3 family ATPase
VTPRLHVVLGAGGVGKTTLAAGYALALARGEGRRVGLLGIDPSRRLKDALGIALGDVDATVPGAGALRAALLQPADSVRRWATEASRDPAALQRLFANPFFAALADRLATATDIFAAARVAEWSERDPGLTDLVVDTAPGLNAIEFLTRPERVANFLGGRMVGWLRWLAREPTGGSQGLLRGGARRVFGGLVRLGGSRMLSDLADFFSLVEEMFSRLLARVQTTQRWLHDPSTELLIVTSVRDDGAQTARDLARALAEAGLVPRAVVVNRALPAELAAQKAPLAAAASSGPEAAAVIRYALAYVAIQARVVDAVTGLAATTLIVPDARGLDADARLETLAGIGQVVRAGLE